jgi:polyhydroxyalkanoate synthesis regulator phasin
MIFDNFAKEEVLENIRKGLKEVKLFKKGKLNTTSASEFINDLSARTQREAITDKEIIERLKREQ